MPSPVLLLAAQPAEMNAVIARLERQGHTVQPFRTAWDALAMFGTAFPEMAVIGTIPRTPCLDLLIEDLMRYGVPILYINARPLEKSSPASIRHPRTPSARTGVDPPRPRP
jgi:hypothetical protein